MCVWEEVAELETMLIVVVRTHYNYQHGLHAPPKGAFPVPYGVRWYVERVRFRLIE
jgi:hypothetical protein